jgi:hypothetical protein
VRVGKYADDSECFAAHLFWMRAMNTDNDALYDEMASTYHLIFEDWQGATDRQGAIISRLVGRITVDEEGLSLTQQQYAHTMRIRGIR